MSEVFGDRYAKIYDTLYRDKDYAAECELLRRVFAETSGRSIKTVLDLGCGSGNHLEPLNKAGFDVTGVDRSPAMLKQARRKVDVPLHCCDIRNCDLDRKFDAVLMMFAVLGYQAGNREVHDALRSVRRHLHPGGLFLFDFWYGPAVLTQQPSTRTKVLETAQGRIHRTATSTLDIRQQICEVLFRVCSNGSGEFQETHRVRFFFPKEIELLLEAAGLRLLRLGAFPDWEREPGVADWNALGVAIAE